MALANITPYSKQKSLSASANALKLCPAYLRKMSFNTLHNLNTRAKPEQVSIYKQEGVSDTESVMHYVKIIFTICYLMFIKISFYFVSAM